MATPLRELDLGPRLGYVLAKLEMHNPSGSHKDRPGRLITGALRRNGLLRPGTKLLVPSSGNFAGSIAYHTASDRVEVVTITDVLSPVEFRDGLRDYRHVRVEVVNDPDETGSHLKARLRLLESLRLQHPDAIEINQYRDRRLPVAYETTLAPEIDAQTGGDEVTLFLPAGTGAMLNGLLKYAVKNGRRWRIVAVDAEGSRLFREASDAVRHFSGYGNAGPTDLVREVGRSPYRFFVAHVPDIETVRNCHWVHRRHRLLIGPSGGATLAAVRMVLRYRPDLIPHYGRVVTVLPDSGRNYLSTVFNDEWLIENGFGGVVSSRI